MFRLKFVFFVEVRRHCCLDKAKGVLIDSSFRTSLSSTACLRPHLQAWQTVGNHSVDVENVFDTWSSLKLDLNVSIVLIARTRMPFRSRKTLKSDCMERNNVLWIISIFSICTPPVVSSPSHMPSVHSVSIIHPSKECEKARDAINALIRVAQILQLHRGWPCVWMLVSTRPVFWFSTHSLVQNGGYHATDVTFESRFCNMI